MGWGVVRITVHNAEYKDASMRLIIDFEPPPQGTREGQRLKVSPGSWRLCMHNAKWAKCVCVEGQENNESVSVRLKWVDQQLRAGEEGVKAS